MAVNKKSPDINVTEVYSRGEWHPAGPSDRRCPCPMINTLANHGYLPRDGKNLRISDFKAALAEVGVTGFPAALFTDPVFLEYKPDMAPKSLVQSVWYYLTNPWAIVAASFGVRRAGQVDESGQRILDLDQLSIPHAVEHDVSLTRRDAAQGDNHTPQPDLIKAVLASSSDGGQTLTLEDMAKVRKQRIETQLRDNRDAQYAAKQHELGAGEVSLILNVIGDGRQVRCNHLKAFLEEERLPIEEGWRAHSSVSIIPIKLTTNKIKKLIGMDI